jgi:hypothetical protein
MLAGVLLHMVKASGPIDLAPRPLSREGSGKQVRNPFPFVHHIGDLNSPKPADIEWLATGSGIERGLVEVDAAGIVRPLCDGRLEIAEVRVGIIESVGHREPGASKWG